MKVSRIAAAIAALLVAAAAIFYAAASHSPTRDVISAPAVIADPAPMALVCSGGVTRQIEDGMDVDSVDEAISTESWIVARGTSGTPLVVNSKGTELDTQGRLAFMHVSDAVADVYSADASSAQQLLWAGAAVHTAAAGDLRGVATSPCISPTNDEWLVGSQTGVGTSNALAITNPGRNAITVDVAAYGAAGPLEAATRSSIVVSAGETQWVSLDGALPDDERIALHLTTETGTFAALLQETVLDGATPAGVTFIEPSVAEESVVIPGVAIASKLASSVRIVNPAQEDAAVSVSVLSDEDSIALPGATDVTVPAGTVMDLSLEGLDAGVYTLQITSNQPITAGVKQELAEKSGTDIAWASSVAPVRAGAAVFAPGDATVAVTAVGESEAAVRVIPISADGSEGTVLRETLAPGRQAVFELPEDTVGVFVYSDNDVVAGVAITAALPKDGGTGVDWVPVHASQAEQASTQIVLQP
ncbi:MAG: DUF5719 family protein [Ancrocorticia sp.]|jgi:hypothetical protein|nr:DUF5719 family protein [Ancrocorticia sp.]MCI2001618.1 DUF5719 family protein [Ancrocorticia sp.]